MGDHPCEPRRLRWDHWLLPAALRIHVRSDGATATVRMQTGNGAPGESVFQRDDGGWRGSGVNPLPQFGTNGSRITLLSRDALAWEDFAEWLPLAVDAVSPEMAAAWKETLAFIRDAPAYVPWVQ
jgi:hypothetical protein